MIKKGGGSVVDLAEVDKSVYVIKSDECDSCEFIPPCRLCTWVSEEVFEWVYNEDTEALLKLDKKYHIAKRRKAARKLGLKEGKGRGNGGKNYNKQDNGGRKGSNSINDNINPMVI